MSDYKQTVERLLEDYNRHDGAAFASYFSEDGIFRHIVGNEVHQGRDQIAATMEAVWRAVPDWKLETRGLYDCGNAVWLAWTITGTHQGEFRGLPPTGEHFEILGCSHFTFARDGLVAQDDVYHDAVTLMGALGMLPDPEAAASA